MSAAGFMLGLMGIASTNGRGSAMTDYYAGAPYRGAIVTAGPAPHTQGAYDAAVTRWEAARAAEAAAAAALDVARAELDAAEQGLASEEAYPGISWWGHVAAYEAPGTLVGEYCGLGSRCKVHGSPINERSRRDRG